MARIKDDIATLKRDGEVTVTYPNGYSESNVEALRGMFETNTGKTVTVEKLDAKCVKFKIAK